MTFLEVVSLLFWALIMLHTWISFFGWYFLSQRCIQAAFYSGSEFFMGNVLTIEEKAFNPYSKSASALQTTMWPFDVVSYKCL